MKLFKSVKNNVSKDLVLRFLGDSSSNNYPVGYKYISQELSSIDVNVHDFAIARAGTTLLETFHAKAIGVDNNRIYIGSSNMSWASKENSMEMGVVLRGETANRLFKVMDKIIDISVAPSRM